MNVRDIKTTGYSKYTPVAKKTTGRTYGRRMKIVSQSNIIRSH